MRVLAACSLGGSGHWRPLVPVLRAALARGDEVIVVAPPALREMIRADGFEYAAGGEPPESAIAPIRERLPLAPAAEASVLGNRDLFGRLAATAMLAPVAAVCRRWRPDLVLRDPCEYASAVVADERGIPVAHVGISPATAEWGSIAVASPALEEHRDGLTDAIRTTPYLSAFPASLDPSPFTTTMRFHEPVTAPPDALPDWWARSDAPLVYLTLGTVLPHLSFAADQYRLALDALATIDARVLLTVGRHLDPSTLGPAPANVRIERWVDQERVLAAASVVVCHGGSGTVFGSLAAGVPLVVLPSFADQFVNGRTVADHGLGLTVEAASDDRDDRRRPLDRDDVPRIAAAISTVLGETRFRDAARAVADELEATPTPADLLDQLTS